MKAVPVDASKASDEKPYTVSVCIRVEINKDVHVDAASEEQAKELALEEVEQSDISVYVNDEQENVLDDGSFWETYDVQETD